jgi:hypothetical protein
MRPAAAEAQAWVRLAGHAQGMKSRQRKSTRSADDRNGELGRAQEKSSAAHGFDEHTSRKFESSSCGRKNQIKQRDRGHRSEVTGETKKIKTMQQETSRVHIEEGKNRFSWSSYKYQTRKLTAHAR